MYNGGAKEIRTPDLCSAIAALYQLSYSPTSSVDARFLTHLYTKRTFLCATTPLGGAGCQANGGTPPKKRGYAFPPKPHRKCVLYYV